MEKSRYSTQVAGRAIKESFRSGFLGRLFDHSSSIGMLFDQPPATVLYKTFKNFQDNLVLSPGIYYEVSVEVVLSESTVNSNVGIFQAVLDAVDELNNTKTFRRSCFATKQHGLIYSIYEFCWNLVSFYFGSETPALLDNFAYTIRFYLLCYYFQMKGVARVLPLL